MSDYIIPAGYGEAEYIDKKSRFIGQVQHAESEAEAMAFVEQIRKKHADATHNVWAYVLNTGAMRWSDDGGAERKTLSVGWPEVPPGSPSSDQRIAPVFRT